MPPDEIKATNRRFRLRAWHLIVLATILALFTVAAVALAYRQHGLNQYRTILAQLKADSRPTTIDDFVALAPVVDMGDQADFARWAKGYVPKGWPTNADIDAWDTWVSGHAPEPVGIRAEIDSKRATMSAALAILRRGRLVLSTLGWAAHDLPIGSRQWREGEPVYMIDRSKLYYLADWIHHDTVLSADATQGLSDLNALYTALGRPGTGADANTTLQFCAIRDRTYIDCALRGRLPPAICERWLAEPAHAFIFMADGFRGDRLLHDNWAVDRFLHGPGRTPFFSSDLSQFPRSLTVWLTAFRDMAFIADVASRYEARLRDEHCDPPPNQAAVFAHYIDFRYHIACPNPVEPFIDAVNDDANHRIARLAMRILLLARDGGLPKDGAELLERVGEPRALNPGGDHLRLLYERLGDRRFRLSVDPTSPLPPVYDSLRLEVVSKVRPKTKPFTWNRWMAFDLELPPQGVSP